MATLWLHACCLALFYSLFSLNVFHFISHANSRYDYALYQLLYCLWFSNVETSCNSRGRNPRGLSHVIQLAMQLICLFLPILLDNFLSSTPLNTLPKCGGTTSCCAYSPCCKRHPLYIFQKIPVTSSCATFLHSIDNM